MGNTEVFSILPLIIHWVLKYVIHETFRLRPLSLGLVRLLGNSVEVEIPNDSNEVRSIIIPSGLATLSCYLTIQRDANVFQNSDTFMALGGEIPPS